MVSMWSVKDLPKTRSEEGVFGFGVVVWVMVSFVGCAGRVVSEGKGI